MTTRKTAEQIADETDHLDGLANRRAIFQAYRAQDESHLWPIRGRFNATTRAIRRIARDYEQHMGPLYGLELCYAIEHEMDRIVNDACNW